MAKKKKSDKGSNGEEKRSLWKVVIVVLFFFGLGYYAFTYFFPTGKETVEVAAIVNGQQITMQELDDAYAVLPAEQKASVTKDAFLDQLINIKLLLQKADSLGIKVEQSEVDSQASLLKVRFKDDAAFEDFLNTQGVTLDAVKENIMSQLKINRLLEQEILSKVEISGSEIEDFFEKNKAAFMPAEGQIRARHILVKTEEEANAIAEQLKKSGDFTALTKEKSLDVVSGEKGGDLGFFSKEDVVPEFGRAAFALKVGEVSKPVKSQFGWHVIMRESNDLKLSDVSDTIKETLKQSKSQGVVQIYINQLVSAADISKGGAAAEVKEDVPVKNGFKSKEGIVCVEEGKMVARLYSASNCIACESTETVFTEVMNAHSDVVRGKVWHLDTGDDVLSDAQEEMLPKEELALYKSMSGNNAVPLIVLGCKYYRLGNAFVKFDAAKEQEELEGVLKNILG